MTTPVLAILTTLALAQTPPAAQPTDAQPANRSADGRDQDRPARGGRMGRDRARRDMQEYAQATPEQRRAMRITQFVGMLDRTYHFDDAQEQAVAAELKTMQQDYYAQLGPDAAKLDDLESKMHDFWAKQADAPRQAGGRRAWRDPEFRKLADDIRKIREQHPFDFDKAVARVEALLPAEQVAKGHERRDQFRQRMEEARRDRADRSNRRPRLQDAGTPSVPGAVSATAPTPIPIVEQPKHPWEVFANDFAADHNLTAPQQAAARAIVKDLIARESAYRASHATQYAALSKLDSTADRDAERKNLEQPVNEMFNELKTRLDDLLTAEQRGSP